MSKLKTAKRKFKHLRKSYHRLIIDNNRMVLIDDVAEWINNTFSTDGGFCSADDVKEAIAKTRLERSKNAFYEHCIKPYSDTTREEFEVECQEKFGGYDE